MLQNVIINSMLEHACSKKLLLIGLPYEQWHLARWHQDTYYNQENDLYSVYGYGFGSSEPGSDVENDAVSDS